MKLPTYDELREVSRNAAAQGHSRTIAVQTAGIKWAIQCLRETQSAFRDSPRGQWAKSMADAIELELNEQLP